MKCSELITQLQDHIAQFGDTDVWAHIQTSDAAWAHAIAIESCRGLMAPIDSSGVHFHEHDPVLCEISARLE